jgi:putative intracellular protease/amidase
MYDLSTSPTCQQIIKEFYESGKVVAAVCHGPAALLNVVLSDGSHLLENCSTTGFSNVEEEQAGYAKIVPYSLEDELNKRSGGKYEKATEAWGPKVVAARGGRLLTGQNPNSGKPLAEAVLAAINK